MYGLPPDIDLTFFHGRALQQVCIGLHEAILRLDGDIELTVQTDIGHRSAIGEITAVYKTIVPAAGALSRLLGASVVGAHAEPPGTLVLRFDTAESIEIYDSSAEYESYQIKCGDKLTVV
jgi:hypothetical protein